MKGGTRYLCANAFAGSILSSSWRVVIDGQMWPLRKLLKVEYCGDATEIGQKLDKTFESVWLIRGGGYGDLLMMTPMIRKLQELYPKMAIHIACGDAYMDLFDGLNVMTYSIPLELPLPYDGFVASFEDWIEGHPDSQTVHIAQHLANKLGIELNGDHVPSYTVKQEEAVAAAEAFPRSNRKRVAIQVMASALYRTYPLTGSVVDQLLRIGCEVFYFGAPGQIGTDPKAPEELVNLTNQNLTFRQSAAVLATCDVAISPDSAMVHLAAALEVPCVGLYGPIPPQLRGSGKHMKGIMGLAPCAPCFFHADYATHMPAGMPCSETGKCIALIEIKPEQIVETALKMSRTPIIRLPEL